MPCTWCPSSWRPVWTIITGLPCCLCTSPTRRNNKHRQKCQNQLPSCLPCHWESTARLDNHHCPCLLLLHLHHQKEQQAQSKMPESAAIFLTLPLGRHCQPGQSSLPSLVACAPPPPEGTTSTAKNARISCRLLDPVIGKALSVWTIITGLPCGLCTSPTRRNNNHRQKCQNHLPSS